MMSKNIQNLRVDRQRKSRCKMENTKELSINDLLIQGLSSDHAFTNLLKDKVFADYFNTFLCLPVFKVRVFYRLDAGLFQMDLPLDLDCQHITHENILSFVRKVRLPLFFKTDICNEYRLCKRILAALNEPGKNEKFQLNLKRVLGSVLSMQRLKAFLHESMGESILSFWLAAERYRRQTEPGGLRFAIKEIQNRHTRYGSWLEVPDSIKIAFNACLKRLSDSSAECWKDADVLVPCQDVAFASLISYWLPKYLSHCSRKIESMKKIRKENQAALQKENQAALLQELINTMTSHVQLRDNVFLEKSLFQPAFPKKLSSILSSSTEDTDSLEFILQLDNSSDRCHSGSSATFKSDNGEESQADVPKEDSSDFRSSPVRLPSLKKSSNLISDQDDILSRSSNNEAIQSRTGSTCNLSAEKGKTLTELYDELRDNSLSKVLVLTNAIKDRSLADVEPQLAFDSRYYQYIMPKVEETMEMLWAALTADQFAGQPFCDYLRLMNHEQAFANIRFWVAAQQFLSGKSQMDTLLRRRQAQAMIQMYMLKDSPRKTSIGRETLSKLVELLPNDLGYSVLHAACGECANALWPFWTKFIVFDEEQCSGFMKSSEAKAGLTQGELVQMDKIADQYHMSNALLLATAISVPGSAKLLLESCGDSDKSGMDTEGAEGSLYKRKLQILNHQAAGALVNYNRGHLLQNSMAYYYYQQNLLLNGIASRSGNLDCMATFKREQVVKSEDVKAKLARPTCFQEVLHDPHQFDAFKRFLIKQGYDLPILFWQAVESMRVNTREAKQRHIRANGILKRFFSPATEYGLMLDCQADIVTELAKMDKVTPPMLVSAQACVAASIEEKWFSPYLATFPEETRRSNSVVQPTIRMSGDSVSPCVKSLNRRSLNLWKVFCGQIISFLRGIANKTILRQFQSFLRLEHKSNAKKSKEAGEDEPQRVLIKSKIVDTGKLVNDVRFWMEVTRFKDFADAVVLCAKLGNYFKDDELIVIHKAHAIVNCFIDSQVPPKVQINISNCIADDIISHVKNGFIERGLFYDAAFSVFPILLHYWKKFCTSRLQPGPTIVQSSSRTRTPRSTQISRRLKSLQNQRIRRLGADPDHEFITVMFSLENGIRMVISNLDDSDNIGSRRFLRVNK